MSLPIVLTTGVALCLLLRLIVLPWLTRKSSRPAASRKQRWSWGLLAGAAESLWMLLGAAVVAYSFLFIVVFVQRRLPAVISPGDVERLVRSASDWQDFADVWGGRFGLVTCLLAALGVLVTALHSRWLSLNGGAGQEPRRSLLSRRAFDRLRGLRGAIAALATALFFLSLVALEAPGVAANAFLSATRLQIHLIAPSSPDEGGLPTDEFSEEPEIHAVGSPSEEEIETAAVRLTEIVLRDIATAMADLKPPHGPGYPPSDSPQGPPPSPRTVSLEDVRFVVRERVREELRERVAEEPRLAVRLAEVTPPPPTGEVMSGLAEEVTVAALSRTALGELIASLTGGRGIISHVLENLIADAFSQEVGRLVGGRVAALEQKAIQLPESRAELARPTTSVPDAESVGLPSARLRPWASPRLPSPPSPNLDLSPSPGGGRAVEIYGAKDRCSRTSELMRYLDEKGIPYRYRDVDADSMARRTANLIAPDASLLPILRVNGRYVDLMGSPQQNAINLDAALGGLSD